MTSAWQQARDLFRDAVPVVLSEKDQNWEAEANSVGSKTDFEISDFWKSKVRGSGAPTSFSIAAIGALENKGYTLEPYEDILKAGFAAIDANDMPALHVAHMELWRVLRSAKRDPEHPSQKTRRFSSWEELDAAITWPDAQAYPIGDQAYTDAVRAGWWGQMIGGATGTALEGYTSEQLYNKFGPIRAYPRKPHTYNDDFTYEYCFLDAFLDKGRAVTGMDIAKRWVGLIPVAYTAEGVAMDHLHRGIMPPLSGSTFNPFDEWIGAQMRGTICGLVCPGDARAAARLAWIDGEISHTSNGILGEVFNAVLCARAFVEKDMRKLVSETAEMIPADTGYGQVVRHALQACKASQSWREAWKLCDEAFGQYHWIHVYPNAAALVTSLWFGRDDFNQTLEVICGCGHDVDCNAAQVLCTTAVALGPDAIEERWMEPFGKTIFTYMRKPTKIDFDDLVGMTVEAARKWHDGTQ